MARRTNTNGARLMNLTYETLFPEVLSTTQDIEVFTQCPYKWFLKRCARMHKYAYNSDLEAGSEFAKAMEITRTAFYKENLPEYEAVALGKKHILESYGETYASQSFPDTIKIAQAYGFKTFKIETQKNLGKEIQKVLNENGPVVCEIMLSHEEKMQPKLSSEIKPDGRMVSKPLEDMFPFVDREEFKNNMIITPISE